VLDNVNAVAHVLKSQGVVKGATVSLCMPMVPQLLFATLACARIGAVHSVIFAGFSAEAVAERIVNARSEVVFTTDAGVRGGRAVPLKAIVDKAIGLAAARGVHVRRVLVTHRAGDGAREGVPGWVKGRDMNLDEAVEEVVRAWKKVGDGSVVFPAAVMDAEDPLFILYTSGSTGKPKGVLHTTGGYMVWAGTTFKHVFDSRPSAATYPPAHAGASGGPAAVRPDVFFCTADMGWVTGHSYIAYGPLVNGAHTVLFEGTPTYPGVDRLWEVVAKHKVTVLYTAPTAIRALMVHGEAPVQKHDLSSLRILGSVGEPINAEAWRWYHTVVGKGKLPIVDTYWQTETGGVMITSLPGATHMKPGMATKPFFGIDAKIVRQDGTECDPDEGGYLVFDKSWPGMMRSVYGDHERFRQTYFSQMPGRYFTGDGAVRDRDGDIQITGRVDGESCARAERGKSGPRVSRVTRPSPFPPSLLPPPPPPPPADVVNVSGHRLGTAEVESALALHTDVAEAAVVGFPHPIKGEGLYSFVILRKGVAHSPALHKELVATVRKAIGPIATPDVIHFTPDLPKTRSGKILRRVLRKVAAGATDTSPATMGDLSSIADTTVVDTLVKSRSQFAPPVDPAK
jgi:acetyl-CoA synthetase